MHSFDLHSFYEFVKNHLIIFADNSEIHTFHAFYPIAEKGTCCQGKIDKMNSIYDDIKNKLKDKEILDIKKTLGVEKILFFKNNDIIAEL